MLKGKIKMKIIIATIKSWNIDRAYQLQRSMMGKHEIIVYTKKEELNISQLKQVDPDLILFPHWSHIIEKEIFEHWICVVFHMTDLPYGRGGSPLQNLIVRGHKHTMISAIRVTEQLDAGPIYMKKPLSLSGSAQEIFIRCADLVFHEMIPQFLEEIPPFMAQEGEVVTFKRRRAEDGEITADMTLEKIYDYIRMLDGEGYPHAYLNYGDYRLEFERAVLSASGDRIDAKVTFYQK